MPIALNVDTLRKLLPPSVSLLAASKGRGMAEIEEALRAGVAIFGENYVQEAERKAPLLRGRAELHLIGHLQKNKVKRALEVFDMIQTVDSFALAQEISRHSAVPYPILIQINIGGEQQKSGCLPEEAALLIKRISELPAVRIKGLMAMAPHTENPGDARPYFRKMKSIFDGLKKKTLENVSMSILSMGMSGDYREAVEEGSTMIRLGEAFFGPRS